MAKRKPDPPMVAAASARNLEALRATIAAGRDVNATDAEGRTGLHHVAMNGDVAAIGMLVEAGARISAPDASGWTPLHFAAHAHHTGAAERLLAAGASLEAQDKNGNTPLYRAVVESRGRGEMIQLLRAHGADRAHVNHHGVSPEALAQTITNYDVKQWMG